MRAGSLQFERGAHDCHLYRSWSERRDVVVPFITEGLAKGEHCILVSAADSFDRWRSELASAGVDVDSAERQNRLQFLTGETWRTPLAAEGSLSMARGTLATLAPLLREFNGVRIVGDAEWDLDPPVSAAGVCHWEATANVVFEDSDVHTICQYSVEHYDADMLHAALRTHTAVIWGGRRHANTHCEAADILRLEPALNDSAGDMRIIETILSNLDRPQLPTTRGNGHPPG